MKKAAALLLLSLACAAGLARADGPHLTKLPPASEKQGLTYAKDIRPLFEASCTRCHGNERPKGGLRLNSLEAVLKGGEDGKVVIPEKSTASPLLIAVAQIDDETAMPPKRGPGGFGPGAMIATQMMAQGDKDNDKKLSKEELNNLATAWFDKVDPDKTDKLSQQQFAAKFGEILPPQQRQGGRGGQGGGPGGRSGPGGGRGPGGPGGFNPSQFVASSLFTATDTNKDGSLTRAEFTGAFAKWFAEWDTDKTGTVSEDKVRSGMIVAFPQPQFGGPGGRGPGNNGGPGGGRGPGGGGNPGGPNGGGGANAQRNGAPGGAAPKPLTPEQVGIVRAWIDQGAK